MEHHVFQVVRVISPDQVLAISGNDHNAVRTRIRSTAGVIGWRDVGGTASATSSAAPTQGQEGAVKELSTGNVQESSEHLGSTLDGLAW
jgi:hypothetical protein